MTQAGAAVVPARSVLDILVQHAQEKGQVGLHFKPITRYLRWKIIFSI